MKEPDIRALSLVLAMVRTSYRGELTIDELAIKIVDPASAERGDAFAFAFFSEVPEALQRRFLFEMGLAEEAVSKVATAFAKRAGYLLPLAKQDALSEKPSRSCSHKAS